MTLTQLYLQSEAAYETINALGEQGLVQFRDMNPEVNAFQRKFVNEVRRCEEMDRKLRLFETEIEKAGLRVVQPEDVDDTPAPENSQVAAMDAELAQLENQLKEINGNEETLKRDGQSLREVREILRNVGRFFEEADRYMPTQEDSRRPDVEEAPLLTGETERGGSQLA